MPGQLRRILARYAARHASVVLPGLPLRDEEGNLFGHIDRITLREGRAFLEGWTYGEKVGLTSEHHAIEAPPRLPRADVPPGPGLAGPQTPGFTLDFPAWRERAAFWASYRGQRHVFHLPRPDSALLRRAKRRQLLPFLRDSLRAAPSALRWLLRKDAAARARAKEILGLSHGPVPAPLRLAPGLFAAEEALPVEAGVTIVLPIHNALDLLPEVLERVRTHTDLPWRLIAVEDCSSDPEVRPWLRRWRAGLAPEERQRVALLENEINLGFIGSVNRAFAVALEHGDHVVLLNSDALLPSGWASRLITPILRQGDVASVTPMSNDAEIFTAPVICRRGDLRPGEGDLIDAAARRLAAGPATAEAPTGVGFCMAMNIGFLRRLPRFDTCFGKGYGEEVDWCQRARALGWRHLGLGNLFVEHRGGVSFGSAEKLRLVQKNNAIVAGRYPAYDAEVQAFIRADPLRSPRLALGLAWAAAHADGAVPVYLAHAMGGGAENYLGQRIARDLAHGPAAVVLRVGGPVRWRIELHGEAGVTSGETGDTGLMRALLALLPEKRIVYSCGVGDPAPETLPDILISLGGTALEVLFHDYFPASPSYTLLDADGAYRGMPKEGSDDPSHRHRRRNGSVMSLAEWRALWGELVARADKVMVFSEDSRRLVKEAFPQAESRIVVEPHEPVVRLPHVQPARARDGHRVIGVLGNIGRQKGAAVVAQLSEELARTGAARIALLGNMDPAYRLDPGGAEMHGDYAIGDIPGLVRHYGISCWLIPSIWPETFSYTTHEALATGLPVWCFDLGAQAEAVRRARGAGGVIPLAEAADPGGIADRILGHAPGRMPGNAPGSARRASA